MDVKFLKDIHVLLDGILDLGLAVVGHFYSFKRDGSEVIQGRLEIGVRGLQVRLVKHF